MHSQIHLIFEVEEAKDSENPDETFVEGGEEFNTTSNKEINDQVGKIINDGKN